MSKLSVCRLICCVFDFRFACNLVPFQALLVHLVLFEHAVGSFGFGSVILLLYSLYLCVVMEYSGSGSFGTWLVCHFASISDFFQSIYHPLANLYIPFGFVSFASTRLCQVSAHQIRWPLAIMQC